MPRSSHMFALRENASLDDLLTIAAQKYAVAFEPVTLGEVTVQVLQITNMRERLDTLVQTGGLANALTTLPLWAKIWPASIVLGHYLRHLPRTHSVLELGAGCGVCGLAAAALNFSKVCISDINEDALLFARINSLKNNLASIEVKHIDITDSTYKEKYSLIIGAEILYLEPLYRPLTKFLRRNLSPANAPALSPENTPMVILAADHRRTPKRFFSLAAKDFSLAQKQVGIRSTGTDESPERHLITLHTLTRQSSLHCATHSSNV